MSEHPAEKDAPRRCRKRGHKWRPKAWGVLGEDVCARWGCTAARVNPRALPPEGWPIPPESTKEASRG